MKLAHALLGLTIFAWLICESRQFGSKNMGPYNIVIQQASTCEDQGTRKGNFNVSLYLGKRGDSNTRQRLHRGSFSWPFTREEMNDMEVQLELYQKKSNDYLLSYNYSGEFCRSVQIAQEFYDSVRKEVGVEPDGCKLPIGNYTFNDWDIPFSLPTPMFEYGSYRVLLRVLQNKEVFGCVLVFVDFTPKR